MRRTRTTPVSKSIRTVEPVAEFDIASGLTKVAPERGMSLPIETRWENALGAAMMAGIAFLPIVIGAGFLADHLAAPSVPGTISIAALRGAIDGDPQNPSDRPFVDRSAQLASTRVRAGF